MSRGSGGTRADPGGRESGEKKQTTTSSGEDPKYSKSGYGITPLPRQRVEELAAKLSPEQYRITQQAGTEPAFCGDLLHNEKDGAYLCAVCGRPTATQIESAKTFWEAEDYHQGYHARSDRVCHPNVNPVLQSLRIDPD